MDKIDLVDENLWDHYSGLPNPAWYQYKKEQEDGEEDNIGDGVCDITD